MQGGMREPMQPSKIRNRRIDATKYDWLVETSVVPLFLCAGPTAIARFVVAIVVDAVKLVLWWARAHIFDKRGEVMAPSVAHRNAAPAPVGVSRVRRVVAAAAHIAPRLVFAAAAGSCFVTMNSRTLARALAMETTAASRAPRQQMAKSDVFYGPAITLALHAAVSASEWFNISDYRESFESSAIV
jgi:hypothetical protein